MTQFFVEAGSAAGVIEEQLRRNEALYHSLGKRLRQQRPQVVLSCARGSSDHAATYGKYLIERFVGVPTSSFAPSISSIYAARQQLDGSVFIALSQSGKSPDLLSAAQDAAAAGALVIAIVNQEASPLAALADEVVPVCAGPEYSVAATKSYIATLAALLCLVAAWTGDNELRDAKRKLPSQLRAAWRLDWTSALLPLKYAKNLFVVGRGFGLGVAQEMALKFKETCALHAEAFSAAEVKHGPMAIVGTGLPVVVLSQQDESRESIGAAIDEFIRIGASVILVGDHRSAATNLPTVASECPATEPILFVQSAYRMIDALAAERGYDPDSPRNLRKVTETK